MTLSFIILLLPFQYVSEFFVITLHSLSTDFSRKWVPLFENSFSVSCSFTILFFLWGSSSS